MPNTLLFHPGRVFAQLYHRWWWYLVIVGAVAATLFWTTPTH
jgi:hypothetical protein